MTIDAAVLDAAHDLGINVSAVVDAALRMAVVEVRRTRWLDENADAFARQAEWHDRNGHPLAEILVPPGKATWSTRAASTSPKISAWPWSLSKVVMGGV